MPILFDNFLVFSNFFQCRFWEYQGGIGKNWHKSGKIWLPPPPPPPPPPPSLAPACIFASPSHYSYFVSLSPYYLAKPLFVCPSPYLLVPAPIRWPQPIFASPSPYSLARAPINKPEPLFLSINPFSYFVSISPYY